MAASNGGWVPKSDERFWRTVWPQLKSGDWRYELQPVRPPRAVLSAGGERRNSAVEGSTAVSDLNGSNNNSSDSNSSSSSVNDEGNNSDRTGTRRDSGEAEAETTQKVPVFFPPPLGVASEALEEAMRRNLPADGSAGEERLDRLEGVDAVVELLTQVPGFPGTTSFGAAPSMDAVAAAARAVLVRTPSPKQPAAVGAAVPVAKRAEVGGSAFGDFGDLSQALYINRAESKNNASPTYVRCTERAIIPLLCHRGSTTNTSGLRSWEALLHVHNF